MISDKTLTEEELTGRALCEAAKEVVSLFKERRWYNNGASKYFAVIQKLESAIKNYCAITENKDNPEILY